MDLIGMKVIWNNINYTVENTVRNQKLRNIRMNILKNIRKNDCLMILNIETI